jgi:hypothetical protein
MGAHDSRIAVGHAGYLLAICGRLSGRAWRFAVPAVSLPPGRPAALLLMPAGFVSRGYGVPLFGNTPPFETSLRGSSACIVRNCTNI